MAVHQRHNGYILLDKVFFNVRFGRNSYWCLSKEVQPHTSSMNSWHQALCKNIFHLFAVPLNSFDEVFIIQYAKGN